MGRTDFLISADHDAAIIGIAAQPFRLDYVSAAGDERAHTPDFFLRIEGRTVEIPSDFSDLGTRRGG